MMATFAQLVNRAMLLELALEDHLPHVELPLLAKWLKFATLQQGCAIQVYLSQQELSVTMV